VIKKHSKGAEQTCQKSNTDELSLNVERNIEQKSFLVCSFWLCSVFASAMSMSMQKTFIDGVQEKSIMVSECHWAATYVKG